MHAALRALILGAPELTALCKYVSWLDRPERQQMPGITLQRWSNDRGYTYDGPDGLHGDNVQIDIWAAQMDEALAIYAALEPVIEAESTADGHYFKGFWRSWRELSEDVPGVGRVYRIRADAEIWWHTL